MSDKHSAPLSAADGSHAAPVPRWQPSAELDEPARESLRRYLTPRLGLDGRLYWPLDELVDADV